MRFEDDVVYVDVETGRTTVQALGPIPVDADSVELVTKLCRREMSRLDADYLNARPYHSLI